MQKGCPITFMRQALRGKYNFLFTYKREMFTVILVVLKWKSYLLERPFKIRRDQQSLHNLLEQGINTPAQQKWLNKLMGFEYTIEYKEGLFNHVEDALSCFSTNVELHAISLPHPLWFKMVRAQIAGEQVA